VVSDVVSLETEELHFHEVQGLELLLDDVLLVLLAVVQQNAVVVDLHFVLLVVLHECGLVEQFSLVDVEQLEHVGVLEVEHVLHREFHLVELEDLLLVLLVEQFLGVQQGGTGFIVHTLLALLDFVVGVEVIPLAFDEHQAV